MHERAVVLSFVTLMVMGCLLLNICHHATTVTLSINSIPLSIFLCLLMTLPLSGLNLVAIFFTDHLFFI